MLFVRRWQGERQEREILVNNEKDVKRKKRGAITRYVLHFTIAHGYSHSSA
jgi:hypothetical protein